MTLSTFSHHTLSKKYILSWKMTNKKKTPIIELLKDKKKTKGGNNNNIQLYNKVKDHNPNLFGSVWLSIG